MIYIGTYGTGIYQVPFEKGALGEVSRLAEVENPSYLCTSKNEDVLYTVIETGTFQGQYGGGVAMVSRKTGQVLSCSGTASKDPCHITENPDGSRLYAANYSEGSLSLHPVKENQFGEAEVLRHEGHSAHPERQEKAHVHCVCFTPDQKYLCVVDLGIDEVVLYQERSTGLRKVGRILFPDGAGPRHITFSDDGKFAYVVTELTSEIFVYRYEDGNFTELQVISALPEGISYPQSSGAAIHLWGDYLFSSNRGHDSIAVFKRNQQDGTLSLSSWIPAQGKTPRDFLLFEEDGSTYLLAANQGSDNLALFSFDEKDGTAKKLQTVTVEKPVCLLSLPE